MKIFFNKRAEGKIIASNNVPRAFLGAVVIGALSGSALLGGLGFLVLYPLSWIVFHSKSEPALPQP